MMAVIWLGLFLFAAGVIVRTVIFLAVVVHDLVDEYGLVVMAVGGAVAAAIIVIGLAL